MGHVPQTPHLQCPQLLLYKAHALLSVQVLHRKGAHVLVGDDGEKRDRGVRSTMTMHTKHKLWAVTKHCPWRSVFFAKVLSRGPSSGPMSLIFSPIQTFMYMYLLQRRQSQVPGPQVPSTPGSSHPATTFQNIQDGHPPTWANLVMHLGR